MKESILTFLYFNKFKMDFFFTFNKLYMYFKFYNKYNKYSINLTYIYIYNIFVATSNKEKRKNKSICHLQGEKLEITSLLHGETIAIGKKTMISDMGRPTVEVNRRGFHEGTTTSTYCFQVHRPGRR